MLGILLVLLAPGSTPLLGLAVYTLWMTGPLSPLFPVGLEPAVMFMGRVHSPLLVAATVTGVGLWVEFLSYHLYRVLLETGPARSVGETRVVIALRDLFQRAPFFTVWVSSWSPFPFWVVRILAAMGGYAMDRYLLAVALGRLPKFWAFAALGLHRQADASILIAVVMLSTLLTLIPWLCRRHVDRSPGNLRSGSADITSAPRQGASIRNGSMSRP